MGPSFGGICFRNFILNEKGLSAVLLSIKIFTNKLDYFHAAAAATIIAKIVSGNAATNLVTPLRSHRRPSGLTVIRTSSWNRQSDSEHFENVVSTCKAKYIPEHASFAFWAEQGREMLNHVNSMSVTDLHSLDSMLRSLDKHTLKSP